MTDVRITAAPLGTRVCGSTTEFSSELLRYIHVLPIWSIRYRSIEKGDLSMTVEQTRFEGLTDILREAVMLWSGS